MAGFARAPGKRYRDGGWKSTWPNFTEAEIDIREIAVGVEVGIHSAMLWKGDFIYFPRLRHPDVNIE